MSELNLLVFGCVVSFIAVAGAYVYIRECFTAAAAEEPSDSETRPADATQGRLQDVA